MAKRKVFQSDDITRFINSLVQGDEHAKRVLSLSNATLGVLQSASLAVHAIGQGLSHAKGLTPKHAVKQVDRLLSNRGIDVDRYFAYWVPHVIGEQNKIHVAMDWMEFDRDAQATLVLSLITGQGRSAPAALADGEARGRRGRPTGGLEIVHF